MYVETMGEMPCFFGKPIFSAEPRYVQPETMVEKSGMIYIYIYMYVSIK